MLLESILAILIYYCVQYNSYGWFKHSVNIYWYWYWICLPWRPKAMLTDIQERCCNVLTGICVTIHLFNIFAVLETAKFILYYRQYRFYKVANFNIQRRKGGWKNFAFNFWVSRNLYTRNIYIFLQRLKLTLKNNSDSCRNIISNIKHKHFMLNHYKPALTVFINKPSWAFEIFILFQVCINTMNQLKYFCLYEEH